MIDPSGFMGKAFIMGDIKKKAILYVWISLSGALGSGIPAVFSQSETPSMDREINANPAVSQDSATAQSFVIPKVIHVIGSPEIPNGKKGDLYFTQEEVIFKINAKSVLTIPYKQFSKVVIGSGRRDASGTAAAAAIGSIVAATLILGSKNEVDSIAIDYTRLSGAKMRMILHMEKGQGEKCKSWFASHGVTIESLTPEQPANTK
jgi:hypothetical protein